MSVKEMWGKFFGNFVLSFTIFLRLLRRIGEMGPRVGWEVELIKFLLNI